MLYKPVLPPYRFPDELNKSLTFVHSTLDWELRVTILETILTARSLLLTEEDSNADLSPFFYGLNFTKMSLETTRLVYI